MYTYNSISLIYKLTCGGEDIEIFLGNIILAKALGGKNFINLRTEKMIHNMKMKQKINIIKDL